MTDTAPTTTRTADGPTVRLTVSQALVRFLAHQHTERDGVRHRMFAGCWGILGHGNVAGLGQALLQSHVEALEAGYDGVEPGPEELPFYLARNEQSMVHAAVAYARTSDRMRMFACAASIGPGSTNMLTGAALATVDRIPVLLLPSDTFASRASDPVLQQLEDPRTGDVSVNDAFRPLSRYWDRIARPEQLLAAAPAAMRVLTDPAETGAVTLCLPQDVQAEAYDWPVAFFRPRVWHVARPVPEPAALARAVAVLAAARRPLIVAGGGAVYSQASEALAGLAAATGIPVADTQAGKGAIAWDHPQAVGGIGATGSSAANALAAEADVVLGVGTRYTDFTTASRTVFADPGVQFVNLNVLAFDAAKLSAHPLVADAREGVRALREALAGYRVSEAYADRASGLVAQWTAVTERCYAPSGRDLPAQTEIFGVLNALMGPEDILVNAAGSMPGDLQALWRASSPRQYHLEYGFSCMGYEIPAAMGAKLAAPEAEVVAIVGDGTYQMNPQEITTIVSEGLKVILVVLQNHGYASIGALSDSLGSQRFGTRFRMRQAATGQLDGGLVPFDIAANARSLGADVLVADGVDDFREAFLTARAATRTTVICVETDIDGPNPPSSAWWDVPVAEVATLDSTRQARETYDDARRDQRRFL
ncbi:3D-(3,5/4)-trihydroxycyclohexane-1,2-dione acylhydrolase (decyclizing) [Georgenia faecalis]|uniref:3D-(3,5/4)-trihydroxycyclohexane-1,2-dione acylhydrolase (Decyclizing) n=1 Tax=Georgenia faecalis TaxID=2483799 RepID=A0ABV9DAH9_9MICO|nr:3D-(3,5/4)-trihydroxycyclohexane-1,2-dione acylhydrolase (decyclizing) [Georgenia faecalis]